MYDEDLYVSLLQLPDSCLVAVLRCCAVDPRSICSAARAHSRLHQAAVIALNSITAEVDQQQLDSLVDVYLATHGSHIHSISLKGANVGDDIIRHQLPDSLTQLSSLQLYGVDPRMQPGGGHPGVLGAAVPLPLKQLQLKQCIVLDQEEGLIAALARLPGLEHLSIVHAVDSDGDTMCVPLGEVLPGLQQLTYLEIENMWFAAASELFAADEAEEAGVSVPDPIGVQMQHLSVLTRLADLRLLDLSSSFTASMLSGVQSLTRLQLAAGSYPDVYFEPAALAGKTVLQHLELKFKAMLDGAQGAQMLAQLQLQQELTCLKLHDSSKPLFAPPVAAFAALTASSTLRHLDVSRCSLPEGVWQHVFPTGRQLPHLRVLGISAAVPEGTRLVSCCPGLESLTILGLERSRELLAPLQGLSSIHTLHMEPSWRNSEGFQGVVNLTRLRKLKLVDPPNVANELLLQLTQLTQLTSLDYNGSVKGGKRGIFQCEVGCAWLLMKLFVVKATANISYCLGLCLSCHNLQLCALFAMYDIRIKCAHV
jgi:hypothetical protein